MSTENRGHRHDSQWTLPRSNTNLEPERLYRIQKPINAEDLNKTRVDSNSSQNGNKADEEF